MLRFNKKTEYAIIALLFMSQKDMGGITNAREISETFRMPYEMTGKVMHALAKKGLIASIQGIRGGYKLQKSLKIINIAEVITIFEGPINLVDCVSIADCPQLKFCNIKDSMNILQDKLNQFFSSITLHDLQKDYAHMLESKSI